MIFGDKKIEKPFLGVAAIVAVAAVFVFASVAVILVFALPAIYTETVYGIVPNEIPRPVIEMLINQ